MNKVILMGRLTREPEVRYSNGAFAGAELGQGRRKTLDNRGCH